MRSYMFLLLLLLSTLVPACDIDELLDIYRKESDLSKQTKNEALGHIDIYTRDDLERMQAYRLSDLINSLRLFRYDENVFGMTDVIHEDPLPYSSDLIKIYINDHEITSAFTGSGLFMYGNIDLGFVDHVEVYSGASSTYVTTEPSLITIKLYSKVPEREMGGHLQAYGGSRGYNHQNISYAQNDEKLDYYIYASRTDAKRTRYDRGGYELSRDFEELHALATLRYEDLKLDIEILQHKMDPFLGYSMFAMPKSGGLDYLLGRISGSYAFLDDDSLKFTFSLIRIDEDIDISMDRTRWSLDLEDLSLPNDHFDSGSLDDTYDFKLEKYVAAGRHNMVFGAKFRSKRLHDVVAYNNGVLDPNSEFVDTRIGSLYLQDDYLFSDRNLITLSMKFNRYHSKSNRHNDIFSTYQGRLGYIYNDTDARAFKIFLSFMQVPTEQYFLTVSKADAVDILNFTDISAEYIRYIGAARFSLLGQALRTETQERKLLDGKKMERYLYSYSGGIIFDYDFDTFNTLQSMFYYNEFPSQIIDKRSKMFGGSVRLLNRYGSWDIFNEGVYYERLDSPMRGLCYNAAVRYRINEDFIVSLKGSNIFDSMAKSEYLYFQDDSPVSGDLKRMPPLKRLYYAPIDRLITVGLEYSF